jgi:hypothetical protein
MKHTGGVAERAPPVDARHDPADVGEIGGRPRVVEALERPLTLGGVDDGGFQQAQVLLNEVHQGEVGNRALVLAVHRELRSRAHRVGDICGAPLDPGEDLFEVGGVEGLHRDMSGRPLGNDDRALPSSVDDREGEHHPRTPVALHGPDRGEE